MAYFKSEKHFAYYIRQIAKFFKIDIPYASIEFRQISLAYQYNNILIKDEILSKNITEQIAFRIRNLKQYYNYEETMTLINRILEIYVELDEIIMGTKTIKECKIIQEEIAIEKESIYIPKLNFSKEAMSVLIELELCSGIYFLYDSNKNLSYIGRSENLSKRIPDSASERKAFYFKFYKTNSKADCYILEPFFIATFKPPLNREFVITDFPTVKIDVDISEPKMDHIRIFNN